MADFKSTTLLNAIKESASAIYKDRVPDATEQNLREVGTAIMDYDITRNEFANALFNKIGLTVIKNKMFENPLKEFKRGMLDNGQDIEEIFVELCKASAYDPAVAETEVFKRNIPDVRSIFHRINREDMYKQTTSITDLQKAFTSESGMQSVIDKIISGMYVSDEQDEFLIMKAVIGQYGVEGKFIPVVVNVVNSEATAKIALAKIKEVSNNMTFISTNYNFAGVNTHTPKAEQVVLISTAFDALIDVEVLASAFNMDKADFIGRRVLIDDFGGLSGVLCAVVDKEWFMDFDRLISAEQIYNPEGRYFNNFLHHHGVYSVSRFENAVLFVTSAPTVASVTVTPDSATLANGKKATYQLVTEASGTNYPPSKCSFASDNESVYVNSSGMVSVPTGLTDVGVTITATSVFDPTKSDTFVVTIGTP